MKTDKFKTNKFAKKYKEELNDKEETTEPTYLWIHNKSYLINTPIDELVDALDNANQVKSWKRSPISQTVNLTYLFLAFIIGFSVCAIVLTPIIIKLF